jgi:hypothetical protein
MRLPSTPPPLTHFSGKKLNLAAAAAALTLGLTACGDTAPSSTTPATPASPATSPKEERYRPKGVGKYTGPTTGGGESVQESKERMKREGK